MRIYLDYRDWWVGYYRGTSHHYICPLPCVVIEVRRRPPTSRNQPRGPSRRASAAVARITLEELVADAHLAVIETDWADEAAAVSTVAYLRSLQASLPTSHQFELHQVTQLGRFVLGVADREGSWTVCVPGVGSVPAVPRSWTAVAAWDLIQHNSVRSGTPLDRAEDPTEQETTS